MLTENKSESGQICDMCARSRTSIAKEGQVPLLKKIEVQGLGDIYLCLDCMTQAGTEEEIIEKIKMRKRLTPKEIFERLKANVIGQDAAAKTLAVAAYNHYKRANMPKRNSVVVEKSNVLLIGPTGCGKTYLCKCLADIMTVPFVMVDATIYTQTGYIGSSVDEIIEKLFEAAGGKKDLAEKGIVFIDEIDKLAKRQNGISGMKDPAGEGTQQELLKLIEGKKVDVKYTDESKTRRILSIDTSNILFICGGAFEGIDTIIRNMKKKTIGFTNENSDNSDNIESALYEFGMLPEFMGRMQIKARMRALDESDYVRILTEPRNALVKQYATLMQIDGVTLQFEDGALRCIAKQAAEKREGARALRGIMEKIMENIMFEIPSDPSIISCCVTENTASSGEEPIYGREKQIYVC